MLPFKLMETGANGKNGNVIVAERQGNDHVITRLRQVEEDPAMETIPNIAVKIPWNMNVNEYHHY